MPSASARPPRRWSRHRWNNRLSLYLIHKVTPRLPRPLLHLTHYVTTAVCYLAMRHERAASLSNLHRICGETGLKLRRRSFSLFHNFSHFMVSRMEVGRLPIDHLARKVVNLDQAISSLRAALHGGGGAVVATAHFGNWEMGIQLLRLSGREVHVVMMADGEERIEEEYQRLRSVPGVEVHRAGNDRLVGVDLLAALRRGGIVALQADRDAGTARVRVDLFGAPTWLPVGPASLARAAGVPILPSFILMEPKRRVRVLIDQPIQVPRTADAEGDLARTTQRLARSIEKAVAARPDQWFNFYPVWSEEKDSA